MCAAMGLATQTSHSVDKQQCIITSTLSQAHVTHVHSKSRQALCQLKGLLQERATGHKQSTQGEPAAVSACSCPAALLSA